MRILKLLFSASVLLLVLVFVYAHFIEAKWIRIRKTEISLGSGSRNPASLRIAHLTDLHLSPAVSLDYLRSAFRETANQRPDLICLTGDYITTEVTRRAEFIDALKILSSAAPTYACPGNHDGGAWAEARGGYPTPDEIRSILSESKVIFLENGTAGLEIRNHRVVIGGLGDIWAKRCDPEAIRKMLDTAQADLRIILSHNPDSKTETGSLKWDLLLAGHTHGGQLYLPFLGAPFAPVNDKRYLNGLYEYGNGKIHVSAGVGNLHGVRLNCRPEISILDIRL